MVVAGQLFTGEEGTSVMVVFSAVSMDVTACCVSTSSHDDGKGRQEIHSIRTV